MFRTHASRGLQRFLDLRSKAAQEKILVQLVHPQLTLLEETEILSLGEKIELLCLLSGNKLTTEIFTTIRYTADENGTEIPDKDSVEQLESLFRQLPFPYFQDFVIKKNKKTGKEQRFTWFQVSANRSTHHFLSSYASDLTEFEEGVLYGFPLTAIRAFSGLIEASDTQPQNVWSHYLGGVFSKNWFVEEDFYYQQVWEDIRKISPKIVQEAEKRYLTKILKE